MMMDLNAENEFYLPETIRRAMYQDPELGVCVIFKDNKFGFWAASQCAVTKFAKQHLKSVVIGGKVSDFEHDFVIVNKNGEICSANCKAKIDVDEYGIIHVENDKLLVKPLEDADSPRYVSAKTLYELNRKIKYLIKAKQVKRPQGFGQYGYPETSGKGGPSF